MGTGELIGVSLKKLQGSELPQFRRKGTRELIVVQRQQPQCCELQLFQGFELPQFCWQGTRESIGFQMQVGQGETGA